MNTPDQWWGGDSEEPSLEPEEVSFGVVLPFPTTHLPAEGELVRAPVPSEYRTIRSAPREALTV
jgi:hypothetical protein